MFLFFIVIKFLLGLAASLVAEQTNMGVALFVADTTSMSGRVGPGRMGLLPSLVRARLSADAVISLASPVMVFSCLVL